MVYKFLFLKNNFYFFILSNILFLRRFYSIKFFFILNFLNLNIKIESRIFNFLKMKLYSKKFFFFFKKKYFLENSNCLFPRLDTLSIFNFFLFFFFHKFNKFFFLDLCSGSGFLGFLLFYIFNCNVIFLDISLKALKILKFNLLNFGIIDKNLISCCNILKNNFFFFLNPIFICNPPYICHKEISYFFFFNEPIAAIIYNKNFGFGFFLKIFFFISKYRKFFFFFLELNSFTSFFFYRYFFNIRNFFFLLDYSFRVRGFLFLENKNV